MDTDYVEEEVVENPTLKAAYNQPPLHHNQPLKWDYEVDLIGEKIYDKVIHLCEICELPILVYGRMLPCKHIFCFGCARNCEKTCKRCAMRVQKVEKSALGTVYVCTHGAAKHSTKGCRRTYLSQRDLQSHIAHRHLPKSNSESKVTATTTTVAQPVGPQLPLTQQQAALQQASQAVSHSPTVSLPSLSVQSAVPSLLGPNLGDLTSPQATQPPHPSTLTPSRIPGLGEMQPRSSASPIVRQSSPALPPDLNSNPMGLGMNFNLQAPMNSDQGIYRPLDMVPMAQHHQQPPPQQLQQQHMMGMPGGHMPRGPVPKSMPRFGELSEVPVSGALMQSMNSQQMPGVGQASPSMHMTAQMHHQQQHQQQLLPEQQLRQDHQQHALREQHLLHERQRMNLSHHESISKMPSAMLSSSSVHPGPQSQASLDGFGSSPGSYESLQAGQGRTNVNLITVPIQDEGPYPPMSMVSQSQGNSHPFSPSRPSMSQNFSQQEGTQGMNRSNFSHMGNKSPNMGTGIASTPPLPFSQPPGNPRMNNAMAVNPRTGLNNLQASAIVEMFQVLARPQGGTGLMPIPRANNQGLMNPRFNPANWTAGNPRSIQPRMSQNQQRPRGEGQFKSNYFG